MSLNCAHRTSAVSPRAFCEHGGYPAPAPLPLPLLVPRILAQDSHHTLAPNHFAFGTDRLDRRSHFHVSFALLLKPIGNTPARQIVRRQFHCDFVARKNTDKVHPHFSGNMRKNLVPVVERHTKHRIRQRFIHRALNLDHVFFGHVSLHLFSNSATAPPALQSWVKIRGGPLG